MQEDLDTIYEWAIKNKMVFNEEKFEQMIFGHTKDTPIMQYKTSSNEEIPSKDIVKDLGILTSNSLDFKEHIDKITMIYKVVMGILLKTFETRAKGPMIMMFNSYLKSKLEYCYIVWSPKEQQYITKIKNI